MDFWPFDWGYPYSPGLRWEIEPEGIYQNATLRFLKLFPNYAPQQWTLQYGLVPIRGQLSGPITFSSVPWPNNGDYFLIQVPASITKAWAPTNYQWQCFAQASGTNPYPLARHFVSTGVIQVFEDLTSAGASDSRTRWERILDEVDAMIFATAGNPMEEVAIGRGTIAGQTLKGWDMEKLVAFRDYALHMAGNERRVKDRRGGAPNPRYKYAVMTAGGNGYAYNGYPDFIPFA